MIKQYKTALIFLGIILVLVAAVLGLKFTEPAETPGESPITLREQTEIFAVAREDIKTIAVANEQDSYTISFEGEEPKVLNRNFAETDGFKLDSTALEFTSLKAEETVAEYTEEFSKYGLSIPQATVRLTEKSGKTTNLLLGDRAPAGNGYYFALGGSSTVYMLPEYKAEIFLRKLDYYREGTSIAIAEEKVTGLEIQSDDLNMTFVRNTIPEGEHNVFSVYNMTAPYQASANGTDISTILASVRDLSIADYVEDNAADLSRYGFNRYVITVRQGEQTDKLYIGKEYGNKLYIRINNSRNVYGVEKSSFAYLQTEPIKFISSMVYLRNINTVNKIDYTDNINGVKAVFDIVHGEGDAFTVTVNGKPIDTERYRALYAEMIGMTMKGTINDAIKERALVEFRFAFIDGTEEWVQFIRADERRVAVAVDGNIQFYLNRSDLTVKADTIAAILSEYLQTGE